MRLLISNTVNCVTPEGIEDRVTIMKCIGVLAHPLRPQTFPLAQRIAETLEAQGLKNWVYTAWQEQDVYEDVRCADMVIAIGGDGAMLRAARVCARQNIPVLGINMGMLGFLTEIKSLDKWEDTLNKIINDDFWIEKRMMLRAHILREDAVIQRAEALNDIVISADVFGRMISLDAYIDDDWTTSYNADGLLISTATGSTAYALSLGGPILPPDLKNMLIIPAAPHLSMDRPIVLAEGSKIEVVPTMPKRGKVMLSADGSTVCQLEPGDRVRIQASEYAASFVRIRSRNYFYRSLLDRLEPRSVNTNARKADDTG